MRLRLPTGIFGEQTVDGDSKSLSEVHRSVVIPDKASFIKKLFAFSGPGYLVAVGYMDPGN
jgi:manganese transport protein